MVIRRRAPVQVDFAGGFTVGDELKPTSMDYNLSVAGKSLREEVGIGYKG